MGFQQKSDTMKMVEEGLYFQVDLAMYLTRVKLTGEYSINLDMKCC